MLTVIAVLAFVALFAGLRFGHILRPPSRRKDEAVAFLAIFPRKVGGKSSGWLVYLYRKRIDGKWLYSYY